LVDKRTALADIARHLGMFEDRLRVSAEARVVVIQEAAPND
jgi:hypothetical protein